MAADSMDITTPVCGRCQAALSSAAPEGLCPKCIFDLALNPDEATVANFTEPADPVSIPMTPFTGTRLRYFGVYELLEEIARGGMGVVFKARQVNLNRLVALKLISSGALATDAIIKRFKAEAEAAAVLNHPNIVPIYEIGEVQGQHYFSMGLIEGQNLREYVEQHKPSPRQSAEIIIAIARAVHHAHQLGILHRDIKPSNILIDKSGTPHLTDFGLAKIAEHDSTLTHTNAILGTPSYMAPEQARGETKHVTTAADIYGIGAVFYECLTGHAPFGGRTSMETVRLVLEEEPRPPSKFVSKIDRDLETICLKCLEKEPQRRYASAEALADDLNRWLRSEPIRARPVGTIERLQKWALRRPAVAALSAISLLLAVAGISGVIWQWREALSARQMAERTAAAEREAKRMEASSRRDAQQAHAQVAQLLSQTEMSRAEELFREDKAGLALAYFARLLREHPNNQTAARQLISGLSQRSFIVPGETLVHAGEDAHVRISRDKRWFLVWDKSGVVPVFDSSTDKQLSTMTIPGIESAKFSDDGNFVFGRSGNKSVWIRTRLGEKTGVDLPHEHNLDSVEMSPDNRWVVTRQWRGGGNLPEYSSHVWERQTGKQLQAPVKLEGQISFSPDGQEIIIQNQLRVQWSIATGQVITRPLQIGEAVPPGELSLDKKYNLVIGQDRAVRISDVRTGQPVGRPIVAPIGVARAHFSADSQWVLTLSAENYFRIWSVQTGLPITEPLRLPVGTRFPAVLSDNKRLLIPSPEAGEVRFWHICFGYGPAEHTRFERGLDIVLGRINAPVPSWLADLAEVVTGQRVGKARAAAWIPPAERVNLRERILTRLDSGFYGNLASWFLAPPPQRPVLPFTHAEFYSAAKEIVGNDAAVRWPAEKLAAYLFQKSELLFEQNFTNEAISLFAQGVEVTAVVRAGDWPSWGGPDPERNMYAPAAGLPESFDPGKVMPGTEEVALATTKNVKWVAKLGSQSYGNVTVAGGKVFIGTNNDTPRNTNDIGDRGILMCFDEKTGAFLWQLSVPKLQSGKVNDWENLGILSSPAVQGNRVYVVSNRGELLCLSTDGLGSRNIGPFRDEVNYSHAPPSQWDPVIGKMTTRADSPRLARGLGDADIIWRYDMIEELGVFPHNASFTAPLIIGNLVYVKTSNGNDWTHSNVPSPLSPSLVAVNKFTGQLAGEDDAGIGHRNLHADWGSPSAGIVNGRMLLFFGGADGLCYALDAQPVEVPEPGNPSGTIRLLKKVWWADCNPPEYRFKNGRPIRYPAADGPSEIIGTPVFWKNRVYTAVGQDPEHGEGVGNLVCLSAAMSGDVTTNGVIWSFPGINRSVSTASITPEGLLFINDFSGFIYCLEAETGTLYWQHDMKAHTWGSTLVADGRVFLGDEDGDFVILAASKEKKVLSPVNTSGEDGINLGAPIYSTAVVANGVLYVASNTHLFAIQLP